MRMVGPGAEEEKEKGEEEVGGRAEKGGFPIMAELRKLLMVCGKEGLQY